MAQIINLRRAKKSIRRKEAVKKAEENKILHSLPKLQRDLARERQASEQRKLDQHHLGQDASPKSEDWPIQRKHSVSIKGHPTSFSLEDEFYAQLMLIAKRDNKPLASLITEIDSTRSIDSNLSSAIRVYVLNDILGRGNR